MSALLKLAEEATTEFWFSTEVYDAEAQPVLDYFRIMGPTLCGHTEYHSTLFRYFVV